MNRLLLSVFIIVCALLQSACDKGVNEDFGEYLEYTYYNSGIPTLSPEPISKSNNIIVSSSAATDNGTDAVLNFKGIKIQTQNSNYEITSFKILEDKGSGYVVQSEFNNNDLSVKSDIATVLVLDMSSSLEPIIDDLKSYAADFAKTIVNSSSNSTVAVVFFSSRSKITSTSFYDATNVTQLITLIDSFTDYENKTALYQATNVGIDLLASLNSNVSKSLVVFTDGGDNDSNNPSSQLALIDSSKSNRFTIGLEGNDFIENDIKQIASTNSQHVVAQNETDLQNIFRQISLGVISVYEVNYNRSNALLSSSEEIKIRIECEAQKIE